jgi:hypothetical protein
MGNQVLSKRQLRAEQIFGMFSKMAVAGKWLHAERKNFA